MSDFRHSNRINDSSARADLDSTLPFIVIWVHNHGISKVFGCISKQNVFG